jgi:hypothetical protein
VLEEPLARLLEPLELVTRLIEALLAELVLRDELEEGGVALVGVKQGEIVVDAVARARTAVE